jgi:hypothetical protein
VLNNTACMPECFHRLMADESAATGEVAESFRVVEVPTFIFMRNGKEVARHVGSSRGDLIGKILQVSVWVWHGLRGEHEAAVSSILCPSGRIVSAMWAVAAETLLGNNAGGVGALGGVLTPCIRFLRLSTCWTMHDYAGLTGMPICLCN